MPNVSKVFNGQNIFDKVIETYGSLDLTYKLIQDNPDVSSIDADLDTLPGLTLSYDPSFVVNTPPELDRSASLPVSSITTIKLQTGQSIFDAGIMTYGDIGQIYKLIQDSDIDSINQTSLAQRTLTYDLNLVTDNAIYSLIKSGGFVLATEVERITAEVIPYYFDLKSLFTDGHSWRFRADDTGMLLQPGEDLGITIALDNFILESIYTGESFKYMVDDSGMLISESVGILSGQLFSKLLRSSSPEAHVWKFTTDGTGQISEPGEDLGT